MFRLENLRQVQSIDLQPLKSYDYRKLCNLKILSTVLSLYFGVKIAKWLIKYIRHAWIINKIPGPFMIPFIGNANHFFSKHSRKFYIYSN